MMRSDAPRVGGGRGYAAVDGTVLLKNNVKLFSGLHFHSNLMAYMNSPLKISLETPLKASFLGHLARMWISLNRDTHGSK